MTTTIQPLRFIPFHEAKSAHSFRDIPPPPPQHLWITYILTMSSTMTMTRMTPRIAPTTATGTTHACEVLDSVGVCRT